MDEELRAIALQQEAAEVESDLIAQALTFRDRLHAADGAAQLSLRGLYEQGSLVQGESASASGSAAERLQSSSACGASADPNDGPARAAARQVRCEGRSEIRPQVRAGAHDGSCAVSNEFRIFSGCR